MQHDALADLVVLTVKSALAPLIERIATAEARVAQADGLTKALAEVRDRLVVVETKAAMPPQPDAAAQELRERVLAIEHKEQPAALQAETLAKTLGDVRDRLVVAETKAGMPQPPDTSVQELRDRIGSLEQKETPTIEIPDDFVQRLAALESTPVQKAFDPTPLFERLVKVEARLDAKVAETLPILASVADTTKDLIALRERVAVVEVRAQVPGPAGKDGADGKDGQHGKDGADGLGFDDMDIEFDGERTFALKYVRGERVKTFGSFTVPMPIYRGIFSEGKSYQAGDVITYGGNAWYCRKETSIRPDYVGQGPQPKDFWTLMVKHGRDGKDGRDAVTLPVVTVGGR